MRILHVIDSLLMGGAENLLIGLAGEQSSRGHEVTVAPLVCNVHTPVQEKLEAKGVLVKPLAKKGSVYNPFFIFKIARLMYGFDIVHVHLFPALYWAGFAKIISFSRTPLVYTEHSTNNKRRGNKLLHLVDVFVYKHCYKQIIACAEKAYDTYKKAFPTINSICYINNGVDTKIYMDAKPYTKKELLGVEECFVVTMVARFMTMKRQDTIVEALAILPEKVHVVFVGGEESDEGLVNVKKMAEKGGVISRTHFLYIRKDVPRILKTSDVVIMASDYEGLSLSSIEGMAAGKPFIATDVNGLREVIGGAGLLFENKNSIALANIIQRLFTDKEYYDEVAIKCSKRAKQYDIHGVVNDYMEVYSNVINA